MNDRQEYRKSLGLPHRLRSQADDEDLVQPATLPQTAGGTAQGHTLYQDGDKDAPDQVKDRNGQIVLGECRYCRRAEVELDEQCTAIHVKVDVGCMTESNGRKTWYVTLYREGSTRLWDGFNVFSSPSEGHARYYADEFKHFFGQGPKPDVTKYDVDRKTGLPGEEQ